MKKLIDRVRTTFARGATEVSSTSPPGFELLASDPLAFDPLDPGFVQDPYPLLRALRERDPVHRSPMGAWVLTRHDDIVAALANPLLGNAPSRFGVLSARNRERSVAANVAYNIIPFLDEPRHATPRRVISRAFRAQLKRQPLEIGSIARKLLADRGDSGALDVMHDYATPLSIAVLCRLLGIPEQDGPALEAWSAWFFYLFSPIPSEEIRSQLELALVDFRDYFSRIVEEKKAQPKDDLISLMLEVRGSDGGLDDAELVDTCMLIFADGIENVDSAIANAVSTLARHPEQLARLRAEPELLPLAVDECLRFETPAQFVGRVALEDLEIRGVPIKAQAGVLLVLGSANRDPAPFENPDVFDITRAPNPHLAFGKGRHSCIGGPLVRIEMEAAIDALLEARSRWEPVEAETRWKARLGHRWIEELSLA